MNPLPPLPDRRKQAIRYIKRERCRMKTCSAPIFVFRWKPETGKAPGKQRKTRSFPQKRAQINRPWGNIVAAIPIIHAFFIPLPSPHLFNSHNALESINHDHRYRFSSESSCKRFSIPCDVPTTDLQGAAYKSVRDILLHFRVS